MKLYSKCERSAHFFMHNKRMFLDSCVLNQMASCSATKSLINKAGTYYSTFIAAISLLEVGFGPSKIADESQQKMSKEFYFDSEITKVDANSIDEKDSLNGRRPGKKYLYIPVEHEWYGARYNLIKWMDRENTTGRSARKQSNDALIYLCAWNANSFLVTENTKDFIRFNRIMFEEHGGHMPIFTLDDLARAQTTDVIFPDNLQNYL